MATKITALTANTLGATGDLIVMVDDPAGTPLTQKMTFGNLMTSIIALATAVLTGLHAAVVANVNPIGGLTVLHRITASTLTGDVDVTLTHKTRIIDVWCVAVGGAGGAGDTITVKNGATAITNAIDMNVADKVVVRAGTFDDAAWDIAAAGTLRISGASGVVCEVFVLGHRIA